MTWAILSEPKIPHDAVVHLQVSLVGSDLSASGTGVAISPNLILTAGHICMSPGLKMGDLEVEGNGRKLLITKVDVKKDLCLLYSDKKLPGYIKLAKRDVVRDDVAMVIGYPRGVNVQIITQGMYAGLDIAFVQHLPIHLMDVYSVQAAPGNSGSPILNDNMELIGIVSAVNAKYSQITFSVPMNDIVSFMASLDSDLEYVEEVDE